MVRGPFRPNLPMLTTLAQVDGICTVDCTNEVAVEDESRCFRVAWLYGAEGPSLSATARFSGRFSMFSFGRQ